jgi:dephospho-CoA kinase
VRVALTGGIASGKTTVAAILRELGAVVIDSDQLARDVVAPGTPGLAQVVEAFGDEVLTSQGELDRPKMASIVFADAGRREVLEGILHPLIGEMSQKLEAEARSKGELVVNDIPLLVEAGLAPMFDKVIVVDAPVEEATRRMVEDRGWTREEAEARIAAQAPREARRSVATHLIDNSGTLESLRNQVEKIYGELVAA